MMKNKTVFFCSECGNESSKWTGRCLACGAWNTMVEQKVTKQSNAKASSSVLTEVQKPKKLSEIEIIEDDRTSTGIREFDRVLGGGIVKGSLVLVGGDPGIGKSTLLLQMCQTIKSNSTILYT
ncbi:MAG: ATPase domain-containing protein, partial [Clostridia bacterium]|nr:ATPase domain-containing protein [Clostridia bacterium]